MKVSFSPDIIHNDLLSSKHQLTDYESFPPRTTIFICRGIFNEYWTPGTLHGTFEFSSRPGEDLDTDTPAFNREKGQKAICSKRRCLNSRSQALDLGVSMYWQCLRHCTTARVLFFMTTDLPFLSWRCMVDVDTSK